MSTIRLNITLPQNIARQLDKFAGPKAKSVFIAECISSKIEQLEKEKLRNLLIEGYKSTKTENLELANEFEAVDLEGWDEY